MRRAVQILLLATGCSFVNVRGVGSRGATACTNEYDFPILDTLGVVGMALAGTIAVYAFESGMQFGTKSSDVAFAAGMAALIPGAPFYTSATYGYITVARCKSAQRRLASPP